MRCQTIGAIVLCCSGWVQCNADTPDWRLNAQPPALAEADRRLIGRTVCGHGGYAFTQAGIRCRTCPDFTGNAGSDEGLSITSALLGHFTAKSQTEWLLDTDGCEAHYESFGGAILLERKAAKASVASASSLSGKSPGGPLSMRFYKPGFRVNDCLLWNTADARTQVICNEADQAQGEVIGHISVMEISRRGISRWRLLRWYDNSDSELPEILSVVPSGMRRIELDGQAALQVEVRLMEASREAGEKGAEPVARTFNLVFRRAGQRFFADKKTQARLAEISVLIRRMLEE